MVNTIRIEHGNTRMVAHRGVSGLEKENTHSAFIAAGNRSYFGVETDVHITADGKVIVIHDDKTTRVTGVEMVVEQTDFATLRSLPLLDIDGNPGRVDLRMPTLPEYVRICRRYGKVCVLELKNEMNEEQIAEVVRQVGEEGYLDQTIFISFCFENLVRLRKILPGQKVQFLTKEIDDALLGRLLEHRFDLDIYYPSLTKEWIDRLHENGIEVNCWTVNDPAAGEQLVSWGVDYITSNILE